MRTWMTFVALYALVSPLAISSQPLSEESRARGIAGNVHGLEENAIFAFQGASGSPSGPSGKLLVGQAGVLYGISRGGSGGCDNGYGSCGNVFKLAPQRSGYSASILYGFQGGNDGDLPVGSLIGDSNGALYGATEDGGIPNCPVRCGTVFRLSPVGSGYVETVLYRFQGGSDGANPEAGLIFDEKGALYGTTANGGGACSIQAGCGTVFKLTPTTLGYTESVLYRFTGGNDGTGPWAALYLDKLGDLYGTTSTGGGPSCGFGCGTVFELTPQGSGYGETVIYHFAGSPDGAYPLGGVVVDETGAIYGTTAGGGEVLKPYCICGTFFRLVRMGSHFLKAATFSFNHRDGSNPVGDLVPGPGGVFYGITQGGGIDRCENSRRFGCGVVYELAPTSSGYAETARHRFEAGTDGAQPLAGLTSDGAGVLYGTTYLGGSANRGTVFTIRP